MMVMTRNEKRLSFDSLFAFRRGGSYFIALMSFVSFDFLLAALFL